MAWIRPPHTGKSSDPHRPGPSGSSQTAFNPVSSPCPSWEPWATPAAAFSMVRGWLTSTWLTEGDCFGNWAQPAIARRGLQRLQSRAIFRASCGQRQHQHARLRTDRECHAPTTSTTGSEIYLLELFMPQIYMYRFTLFCLQNLWFFLSRYLAMGSPSLLTESADMQQTTRKTKEKMVGERGFEPPTPWSRIAQP